MVIYDKTQCRNFEKQAKIKILNLLGNPYQFASFLASK